jgi:hypothetical protein
LPERQIETKDEKSSGGELGGHGCQKRRPAVRSGAVSQSERVPQRMRGAVQKSARFLLGEWFGRAWSFDQACPPSAMISS